MPGSLFCLLLGTVLAAGPAPVGPKTPPSLEDYIADLDADRRSDRLYAIRELRRQVRQAARESQGRPGSLRQMAALQSLALYDDVLAPVCLSEMTSREEIRGPCADILGFLLTDDAPPVLRQGIELEERAWARRKLERALALIEGTQGMP